MFLHANHNSVINNHHESLSDVYDSLLKFREQDKGLPEAAYNDCLAAEVNTDSDAILCLKIAHLCLQDKAWLAAETLAMKSLIARPKTWAAIRILELSFKGQGRIAEASGCKQKQIPDYLLEKHFPDCVEDVPPESEEHSEIKISARASETFELNSPKFMVDNENQAYQHQRITSKASFTSVLKDGKLWFDGFNIVAWDGNNRIISDVSAGYPKLIHKLSNRSDLTTLTGTVCFLGNRVASNYYHWMNDVIPKLGVLQDSGIALDSIDMFVLPGLPHPFHNETLSHFGIKANRIHRFTHGKYIKADKLLMPVYGSNEHLVRVNVEAWTNLHSLQSAHSSDFLCSSFVDDNVKSNAKKLYISRGNEGSRGISNEPELCDYLKSHGFTVIRAEEHTVSEQAALFSNADVIFGPHGAGFTNIVFCKKGTKVIEIYNDWTASCFWFISEFKGLKHYAHQCTAQPVDKPHCVNENSSPQDLLRQARFTVDLDEIDRLLKFAEVL